MLTSFVIEAVFVRFPDLILPNLGLKLCLVVLTSMETLVTVGLIEQYWAQHSANFSSLHSCLF